MSTPHTPGPWAHRNGRIFAADRENLTIAHVARAADGDYSPANGDVIAAAPDLLIRLKAAANYIDTLGGDSKECRIAIAKAEGKS